MSEASERKRAREALAKHAFGLLEPASAAKLLDISEDELWKAKERGDVSFISVRKYVRYDPFALVAWALGYDCGPTDVPEEVVETAHRWRSERLSESWATPKETPKRGRVYLIETTEGPSRVKIGFSTDPDRRLRSLSTMSPVGLRLLGAWPATTKDEAELHNRLSDHRLHGEWFKPEAIGPAIEYLEGRAHHSDDQESLA